MVRLKPKISDKTVDVLVPTINAEAFLVNSLESIRSQTYEDLRVIVSVDKSEDATAQVARDFSASDDRFLVVEHTERLGWVKAANVLLERVAAERFLFVFHDDTIPPNFIETLSAKLDVSPSSLGISSRTQESGERTGIIDHEAPAESTEERLREQLARYGSAGHLVRGLLMRSSAIERGLRMPQGHSESGAGSVALYDLLVASLGQILLETQAVYHKFVWKESTTFRWKTAVLTDSDKLKRRLNFALGYLDILERADVEEVVKVDLIREAVNQHFKKIIKDGLGEDCKESFHAAVAALTAKASGNERVSSRLKALFAG